MHPSLAVWLLSTFLLCFLLFAEANIRIRDINAVSDDNSAEVLEVSFEEPTQEAENEAPVPSDAFFYESFSAGWESRWLSSQDPKYASGQWVVGKGMLEGLAGEQGLILKAASKHHAISALFDRVLDLSQGPEQELVLQYELRLHKPLECGGAYIKLLQHNDSFTPARFKDDTSYVVMFGPDKCGPNDKIHFILRHRNPITGTFEEKHMQSKGLAIQNDRLTHLYTLVIRPTNEFEIYVDQVNVQKGTLFANLEPPINPPMFISDPNDTKPKDWVDQAKIPDPLAVKPNDWDETQPQYITDPDAAKPAGWLDEGPDFIPDPKASKPGDWDDELDGDWEPPLIANPICQSIGCGPWMPPTITNPRYKGPWRAPLIDNPQYKGRWKPRHIENPGYFRDEAPWKMAPMGGIGFELWSVQNEMEFDNIYVGRSLESAMDFAQRSWRVKHEYELELQRKQAEAAAMAQKEKDKKRVRILDGEGEWVHVMMDGIIIIATAFQKHYIAISATLIVGITSILYALGVFTQKPRRVAPKAVSSTPAASSTTSSLSSLPSSASAPSSSQAEPETTQPTSSPPASDSS